MNVIEIPAAMVTSANCLQPIASIDQTTMVVSEVEQLPAPHYPKTRPQHHRASLRRRQLVMVVIHNSNLIGCSWQLVS